MLRRHALRSVLTVLLVVGVWAGVRACGETSDGTGSRGAAVPSEPAARRDAADAQPRRRARRRVRGPEGGGGGPLFARAPGDAGPAPGANDVVIDGEPLDLPRRHVAGRVELPDGTPARGVSLRLFSTWLAADELALADWGVMSAEGRTDEAGHFRLPYVGDGPRGLVVESESGELIVHDGLAGEDLVLRVPAEPLFVRGRVTRASDGAPVEASVIIGYEAVGGGLGVAGPEVTGLSTIFSEPDGRFRVGIALPAGPITVSVIANGLAPWVRRRVVLRADAASEINVVLDEGLRVSGRVVADRTGEPLPGVAIAEASQLPFLGYRTTRADGTFDIEHLPRSEDGTLWLRFGHATLAEEYVPVSAPSGARVDIGTLRLRAEATLRLRCVDDAGAPIEDVRVIVRSRYQVRDGGTSAASARDDVSSESSDARGAVEFAPVHPGSAGWPLIVEIEVRGRRVVHQELAPLRPGEVRDLGDVHVPGGGAPTDR